VASGPSIKTQGRLELSSKGGFSRTLHFHGVVFLSMYFTKSWSGQAEEGVKKSANLQPPTSNSQRNLFEETHFGSWELGLLGVDKVFFTRP
jgi:hypothetical protein